MGAAFLRKYGTGTGADVYIPIIKRAVVDFAVSGDFTPAAGDVKVSKDGGAAANIGTLPVAVAMGNTAKWKFVFTDAELQAKTISITVSDSATKAVEDQMFVVETYGHASALHPFDLGTASVAQTGDSYAVVSSGTHGNAALKTLIDTIDNFLDTEIAAILEDTGTTLNDLVIALPTAAENAAALLDLTDGVEAGLTPRQALRLVCAVLGAKLSGAGTAANTFRNAVADSANRVTATVDADGNRTAITYNL